MVFFQIFAPGAISQLYILFVTGSKCVYGLKDKAKRGESKLPIEAAFILGPGERKLWANAIDQRVSGAKPTPDPLPTFDSEEKKRTEVIESESTAGTWVVPKRLYVGEGGGIQSNPRLLVASS